MMTLLFFILIVVCVLIRVAFLTLLERKLLRIVGLRLGPNKLGVLGVLQPFSDALKLANKHHNSLYNFSILYYYLRCYIVLFSRIFLWRCFWLNPYIISFKIGFLFLMIILSFGSVNVIIRGWSTSGKYTLLGSLRSVSQLISYESSLYLCFFFFIFLFRFYSLSDFRFFCVSFFCLISPLCFYVWVPCFLAELNRTPFDFSEGERELVRGFNTDLGGSSFTLIFLGEYSNILFFCALSSFFFFYDFFFLWFFFFLIFVIWIRSVLPRFRYDKLMWVSWTFFIPFLTVYLVSFFLFIFF